MANTERDNRIIELLFAREELALGLLDDAYGKLCADISRGLLSDDRDIEEIRNDLLLAVWGAIPPARPDSLRSFVCRLARRLAISRYRHNTRLRRDSRGDLLLSEVGEFVPDTETQEGDDRLRELISAFLRTENELSRRIFVSRYVLLEDIPRIAVKYSLTENAVAVRLSRTRAGLKEYLKKEGYLK